MSDTASDKIPTADTPATSDWGKKILLRKMIVVNLMATWPNI
jgi:hypothetical protein